MSQNTRNPIKGVESSVESDRIKDNLTDRKAVLEPGQMGVHLVCREWECDDFERLLTPMDGAALSPAAHGLKLAHENEHPDHEVEYQEVWG